MVDDLPVPEVVDVEPMLKEKVSQKYLKKHRILTGL
jgi:hypothetical protein